MDQVDKRLQTRESLLILANLRLVDDGAAVDHRVKLRNLSSGGTMAEGAVRVARGTRLRLDLPNVGWVEGAVAWTQDDRFGIAFLQDIDPHAVQPA